ncbi:MAG: hypothetical protein O3B42_03125 [Actinomycetota bacterium]|nr:hypothetical protein [Actinomycetota bacterium]
MDQAFAGMLLLPGEEGPGLAAVLETVAADVKLLTGAEELGSWNVDDCNVTAAGKGRFKVVLGGEMVMFTPDTPIQFAEAMTIPPEPEPKSIPLAARIEAQSPGKKKTKAEPAKIEPLKSIAKDEVLGRTLMFLILAVSSALIVTLLVLTSAI